MFEILKDIKLLFFLLGLLVFSPLSSAITLKYLHLPLALPELIIFPFLFLLKVKFKTIRIRKATFTKLFILLILLFIFGLLEGRFSFFSLLSNSRVWLYLFLFYSMFINKNDITCDDLMYLSLGSLVGWALVSYLNFSLMRIAIDDSTIAVYGTMLSIPIFVSTAFFQGNKKVIVFGGISLVIIMLLSGMRRAIFVLALSMITYFIMIMIVNKKKMSSFLLYIIIMILGLFISLPILGEYINDVSFGLYHRVFVRTELLLSHGFAASSDTGRLDNFVELIENSQNYIIPHGLINHQTGASNISGIFNDFPLVQLCWIFSLPVTILILVRYFYVLNKCISKFYRYKQIGYLLCSNCLIVMFSLLFLEGTFLTFVYASPLTGLLLAKATYLSR